MVEPEIVANREAKLVAEIERLRTALAKAEAERDRGWCAGRDAAADVADREACGRCRMLGESSDLIRALAPPALDRKGEGDLQATHDRGSG